MAKQEKQTAPIVNENNSKAKINTGLSAIQNVKTRVNS